MSEMKVVRIRGNEDGDTGLFYARVRDAVRMYEGIPMATRIAVVSVVLHELNNQFMQHVLGDEQ